MIDDILALTARLAAEPDSLAFLALGEALRRRGQFDAALAIALRGLQRYPMLGDAHDLVARIHSDRGEGDLAFDAWTEALRHDPSHVGARRGLAFLSFRAGDLEWAERHLVAATEVAPDDPGLRAALQRVQERRRSLPAAPPAPASLVPEARGSLLVDGQGRRLAGSLAAAGGEDVSDAMAGELAGVSREAARAARLLGFGGWRGLAVECPDANLHLLPPTEGTLLMVMAEPATPAGRLAVVAERGAASARRWFERLQ
jgi:tetratricopeptide (TPR) repeat protein